MINKLGRIEKGWGHEEIIISTHLYCMKLLYFKSKGNRFSLHYHKNKHETWFIQQGKFELEILNPKSKEIQTFILHSGNSWTNPPNLAHRLTALEDESVVVEVSTADHQGDNYRIAPGDSQKTQL